MSWTRSNDQRAEPRSVMQFGVIVLSARAQVHDAGPARARSPNIYLQQAKQCLARVGRLGFR